jgi:hypothetical protein
MLKVTILLAMLIISLNALSANNAKLTSNLLDNAETQVLDDASNEEITELNECMAETKTNEIGETACMNEIFGDIHN